MNVSQSRREFLRTALFGAAGVAGAFGLPQWLQAAETATPTVRDGLAAAYANDRLVLSHYQAFAQQADREGFGQVASLFRATAKAKQIHVDEFARVLTLLGGKANTTNIPTEVKSTKENLATTLSLKPFNSESFYADHVAQARKESNREALRALNFARTTVTEHLNLFSEARDHLDQWRGGAKIFFVCRVCGFTAATLDKRCSHCFVPADKFVTVT